ncbi:MAG: hydrogenase nickel incorporation protein HypB [Spirochaetes bacterium]|nr:hydrogenase nickel incorporation protein HypB [Spirochaetota bacterium]
MNKFKIMTIKQNVFDSNDKQAVLLRNELKKNKVFLLNLMSSPGSGKTTTILKTIEALKDELQIGVIEADIDSDVDAQAVALTDTKVIQLHSGGMCHLTADMTRQGLENLGTAGIDLVILENIGNLICTAEFDTGAAKNVMILSVPEGDDKPLKYPAMFKMVDVLLVNKMDAKIICDFDLEALTERVKKLNPNIKIFPVTAKTGEGINEWADWLRLEIKIWNQEK